MAQRAALLHDSFRGVAILEAVIVMIGRLQTGPLGIVTLCATERRIDLVVADQAVGHLRHIGIADPLRRIDPPMTRETGVGGIQMRADIVRIG